MSEVNIFEEASRKKLLFTNPRGGGLLTIYQLWDLSIPELNTLLGSINQQLENEQKFSSNFFEEESTKPNGSLQLMHDVVMHVGKTLIREQNARKSELARKAQMQKILGIIEAKEDEALSNKSIEELKAELEKLND